MPTLQQLLSSEALNAQPLPGLSLFFILVFYAPLAAVATLFYVYGLFARRSIVPIAKALTALWLVACIPAGLMMLMGYAFNSHGVHPLILIPSWVGLGCAMLWLPVGQRKLFGYRPV